MAYVDHAFSITDDDLMMDGSYTNTNRPSIKEIGLAVSLLVFGVIGTVVGFFMTSNRVDGDRAHVLGIGVRLGVEQPMMVDWEEVEAAAAVKREDVQAVESGRSSYENATNDGGALWGVERQGGASSEAAL
ncbi:unnamed protein product [Linum trigynum]|uniref:Uncharacterized protein n=1 Tax=Linum trigynum TaxID=586398 RepID=A0AAV2DN71_9ROSI